MSGQQQSGSPCDDDLSAITGRIVAIWESVLDRPGIQPDSDLLELGATSLTAVKIQSRIRAEVGRNVELLELLEHPTPRELASVVAAASPWTGPEPWHQLAWPGESGAAEETLG
jgi:aryl carrier-like protein